MPRCTVLLVNIHPVVGAGEAVKDGLLPVAKPGLKSLRGVGSLFEENAVVQFHLRDARTSAQDLDEMLSSYQRAEVTPPPRGALLFSCLGRGQFLYGAADHDTDAFRSHLGDLPLGGFFCNGEIGPVHGTTFLHGYTSAFGVFRRRAG